METTLDSISELLMMKKGANDHPYRLCVDTLSNKIQIYGRYLELAQGPHRNEGIAADAVRLLKEIENELYLALNTAYLDGRNDNSAKED